MSTLREAAEAVERAPTFSVDGWAVIHAALRVAADVYEADAAACTNQPRIAEQFIEQRQKVRTIKAVIEKHFGL